MNNFLAILELCAFYIECKKVKLTAINFSGPTNIKYFMQTQFLRFCKGTKIFYPSLVKNNYQINPFSPCEEEGTNTVDCTSNK